MRPTAKSLILDLLSAGEGAPAEVRRLAEACALFDISENSVRVTLVRLSAAGLIEAAGRGWYRLGERARGLASEVASWRTAEKRVQKWSGGHVAVHRGALDRRDRTGLRRREKALRMVGLRELDPGLWLRPDNLEGGVEALRKRLVTLGLEEGALVFQASAFEPEVEARIRGLWDGRAHSESYRQTRKKLEAWLDRASRLEPEVAAREAFLLGGAAIRDVVYDPLLPAPLVDVEARRAFVETVHRFDRAGRAIWQRVFGFRLGSAVPSTVKSDPASSAWSH